MSFGGDSETAHVRYERLGRWSSDKPEIRDSHLLFEARKLGTVPNYDEVLLLDPSTTGSADEAFAEAFPNPIVGCIAENRRGGKNGEQKQRIERAAFGEGSRGEEERVAGKDGRDHQTGLGEDDQKENDVGPRPIAINQRRRVAIEVEN